MEKKVPRGQGIYVRSKRNAIIRLSFNLAGFDASTTDSAETTAASAMGTPQQQQRKLVTEVSSALSEAFGSSSCRTWAKHPVVRGKLSCTTKKGHHPSRSLVMARSAFPQGGIPDRVV